MGAAAAFAGGGRSLPAARGGCGGAVGWCPAALGGAQEGRVEGGGHRCPGHALVCRVTGSVRGCQGPTASGAVSFRETPATPEAGIGVLRARLQSAGTAGLYPGLDSSRGF